MRVGVVVGEVGRACVVDAVCRSDIRLGRTIGHDAVRDIEGYIPYGDSDVAGVVGDGDVIVCNRACVGDDNLCPVAGDVAVCKSEHAVRVEIFEQARVVSWKDGVGTALCRRNLGDLGRAVAVGDVFSVRQGDGDRSRDDGDAAFFGGEDIVVCVALGTCGKRLGQSDLACHVGGCRRVGRRGIGRSKAVLLEHIGDRAVIVRHGVAGSLERLSIGLLDRIGGDGDFALFDDEGDVDRIGKLFALSREVELALGVSGERKHGGVSVGVARRDVGIAIVGLARRRASGDRRGVVERDALDAAGGGAGAELRPVRLRAIYDGDRDVVGSFRCRVGKAASDDLAGLVIDIDAGKDGGAVDGQHADSDGRVLKLCAIRTVVHDQVIVAGVGIRFVESDREAIRTDAVDDRLIEAVRIERIDLEQPSRLARLVVIAGEDYTAVCELMRQALAVRDCAAGGGDVVHGDVEQLQRERRLVDGERRRICDVVVVDERALVVDDRRGAERIVAGIARGVGSDAFQDVLHLEFIGGVLVHFGVDDAVNVRDCDRILLGAVVGHGVGVRKRDGDVPLGDCERDGAVCVLGDGVVAFDVLEIHKFRRGADPLIGSDIVADVGGFDVLLVLFGDAVPVVDGAELELVRRHCALRIVARIVGHDVAVLERGDSFGIRREVEHEPSFGNLDGDGRLCLLEVFRLRHADDDLIGADIDQRRTVARDGELRVGRADIDVCHIFGIVRREVVLSRSGVAADKFIERFERSCALRHIDERIAVVRRPVEIQRVSRDRIVNRHRSLVRGRVRNRLESGVVEDEVFGVHEARRHSVLARVFSVGLFKRSVEVGFQVVAERHDVNVLHSSAQAVGAQDFRLGVLRSAVVDQALIAARHERDRSLRNRERPILIGGKVVGVDVVVGVVDAVHGDEVVPGVDHLGHVDFGRRAVVICRCDRGLRIVAGDGAAQHEFERLRFAVIDEFRLGDTERELALRDLEHIVARRAVVVAVVALVGDEFLIRDDEVVSGVLFVRVDEAHVVGADVDRGRPAGIGLALADRPIGVVVDLAEACSAVRRPHLQHGMNVGRVVERFGVDGVCVNAAFTGDITAVIAHIVLDLSAGGEGDFSRRAQSSLPLDGVGLIGLSAVHVRTFTGRAGVGVRPKDAARVGRSGIGDLQAGQRTDRAGLVLERNLSGALVRGCVDRGGGIARVVRKRRGGCGVAVPIEVGDRAAFARADQHIFTSDIVFGSIFYGSAGRGAGIVGQHTVDRGDAARRARRAECQRFGIGRRNGDPHQCAGS